MIDRKFRTGLVRLLTNSAHVVLRLGNSGVLLYVQTVRPSQIRYELLVVGLQVFAVDVGVTDPPGPPLTVVLGSLDLMALMLYSLVPAVAGLAIET